MLPNSTPRINRIQQKNSIRQTVLSGPVDVNGKEDFLEIGTGLEVLSKGLSTDPLVLSYGDGFTKGGQKDITVEVSEQLTWSNLPVSETEVFLYVDLLPDGTFQTGHTLLEPVYSLEKPSTPAIGQAFYSTYHKGRMEVFDGTSWVPTLRIYVGQCETDATDVLSIQMYNYGVGRGYEAPLGSGQKWVNVGGERAVNTTYTNDTGRSIVVAFSSSSTNVDMFVDGNRIARIFAVGSGAGSTSFATVPSGSSYSLDNTFSSWFELR